MGVMSSIVCAKKVRGPYGAIEPRSFLRAFARSYMRTPLRGSGKKPTIVKHTQFNY